MIACVTCREPERMDIYIYMYTFTVAYAVKHMHLNNVTYTVDMRLYAYTIVYSMRTDQSLALLVACSIVSGRLPVLSLVRSCARKAKPPA